MTLDYLLGAAVTIGVLAYLEAGDEKGEARGEACRRAIVRNHDELSVKLARRGSMMVTAKAAGFGCGAHFLSRRDFIRTRSLAHDRGAGCASDRRFRLLKSRRSQTNTALTDMPHGCRSCDLPHIAFTSGSAKCAARSESRRDAAHL